MLFQLACFGTGNSGFDGGFARIDLFFWFRIGLLLFQLARFGAGDSGFDGGFARIDLLFWFRISLLLDVYKRQLLQLRANCRFVLFRCIRAKQRCETFMQLGGDVIQDVYKRQAPDT